MPRLNGCTKPHKPCPSAYIRRSNRKVTPGTFADRLEKHITNVYFASFQNTGQQELLELVNNLNTAELLRRRHTAEKTIPAKAAWETIRTASSEERLAENFFTKSHNAAMFLVIHPTLALTSADMFITLRTIPAQKKSRQPVRENRMRTFLTSMLREAAVLKYSRPLQTNSNNHGA